MGREVHRNRAAIRAAIAALATMVLFALFAALGAARADAYATYVWRVCASGAAQGGALYQTNAPDPAFNGQRNCDWDGADPPRSSWVGVQTGSGAGTVAGGDYGRMHWDMPAGIAIARVYANWWQQLDTGFEHRLQLVLPGGARDVFQVATADYGSDTPRDVRWSPNTDGPFTAFESALVCKRSGGARCDASRQSRAALNQINFLLADQRLPHPSISGEALTGGWQAGTRGLDFSDSDAGSGVRVSTTVVSGDLSPLADSTTQPCNIKAVGSTDYAMQAVPCPPGPVSGRHTIDTSKYSDGEHTLTHCAADFAGNVVCTDPTTVRFDNTAPTSVQGLAVAQGSAWQRTNDFDLGWENPAQGNGAPIDAALYRIVRDAGGYDSGVQSVQAEGIQRLDHLSVPVPGSYTVSVWLRDGAGNSSDAAARPVTVRFDDVPPKVAFADGQDPEHPERLEAPASDPDSGVAGGAISYRRAGSSAWTALPTDLRQGDLPGSAELVARFPSDHLGRGLYEFQAEALDAAGNRAISERRRNGTVMVLRNPVKADTSLTANLAGSAWRCRWNRSRRRCARIVTRSTRRVVPYGTGSRLIGRLTAGGHALGGRELTVRFTPDPGSTRGAVEAPATTAPDGGYSVRVPAGPSQTIRARFAGTDTLARAVSQTVRALTRSRASMTITPRRLRNGRSIRIRGSVGRSGARIPFGGKLVAIQFFDSAHRRWRPVKLLRTDWRGRYRTRYRFHYIVKAARIAFRAAVLPESGWPYSFGASPPVRVKVRP